MLTNHQRGDHEIPEEGEGKNPNNLEKLISSGKKYLRKTGKALVFTTALTAATALSGCDQDSSGKSQNENSVKASTTVSQTQEKSKEKPKEKREIPYDKNFSVPAYSEEKDSIERIKLLDEKARINVQKDDKKDNELEITLKLKDYDKKKEDSYSEFYLNRFQSSPLIVYSPGLVIKKISQKGFVNLGYSVDWKRLSPPKKDKEKKLEIEKEKIQEAIDETYFKSENKKEGLEKRPSSWWQGFVSDLSNNKEMQEVLKKALEKDYHFAIIPPYKQKDSFDETHETAKKTKVLFEQRGQKTGKIWILQGTSLTKNNEKELFGHLERKLIGPAEIEKGLNLWSLKEGRDFKWLRRKTFSELRRRGSKTEIEHSITRWTDDSDKTITLYPNIFHKQKIRKVKIKEKESKVSRNYSDVEYLFPGIEKWGEKDMYRTLYIKEKNIEKEDLEKDNFYSILRLGEGKNKLDDKYIFQIDVSKDFYKEMKKLKKYGELEILTSRYYGTPEVIKKSGWKSLNKNSYSQRFMTKNTYEGLDDFEFGLFVVKNNKIVNKIDVIYGTDNIEKYLGRRIQRKKNSTRWKKEYNMENNSYDSEKDCFEVVVPKIK